MSLVGRNTFLGSCLVVTLLLQFLEPDPFLSKSCNHGKVRLWDFVRRAEESSVRYDSRQRQRHAISQRLSYSIGIPPAVDDGAWLAGGRDVDDWISTGGTIFFSFALSSLLTVANQMVILLISAWGSFLPSLTHCTATLRDWIISCHLLNLSMSAIIAGPVLDMSSRLFLLARRASFPSAVTQFDTSLFPVSQLNCSWILVLSIQSSSKPEGHGLDFPSLPLPLGINSPPWARSPIRISTIPWSVTGVGRIVWRTESLKIAADVDVSAPTGTASENPKSVIM